MDLQLVEQICHEVKSQGIFDEFRRDSMADVDTKPAYQNLRQRVESSVEKFLSEQKWTPEMNKNQLREKLRRHIVESNYLDVGVERIVDQVVNPKLGSVFRPRIEEIAYKFIGISPPVKHLQLQPPLPSDPPLPPGAGNMVHHPLLPLNIHVPNAATNHMQVDIDNLLPNYLEQVSPESEKPSSVYSEDKDRSTELKSVDDLSINSDDEESPPFEPLEKSDLKDLGIDVKSSPKENSIKGEDLNSPTVEDDELAQISLPATDRVQHTPPQNNLNTETDNTAQIGNQTLEGADDIKPEEYMSLQTSMDTKTNVKGYQRLSSVSDDSFSLSCKMETTTANSSQEEARAAAISEEAQMPKFNDNSSEELSSSWTTLNCNSIMSSSKTVGANKELHFDINRADIKFEGTNRKLKLEEKETHKSPIPVETKDDTKKLPVENVESLNYSNSSMKVKAENGTVDEERIIQTTSQSYTSFMEETSSMPTPKLTINYDYKESTMEQSMTLNEKNIPEVKAVAEPGVAEATIISNKNTANAVTNMLTPSTNSMSTATPSSTASPLPISVHKKKESSSHSSSHRSHKSSSSSKHRKHSKEHRSSHDSHHRHKSHRHEQGEHRHSHHRSKEGDKDTTKSKERHRRSSSSNSHDVGRQTKYSSSSSSSTKNSEAMKGSTCSAYTTSHRSSSSSHKSSRSKHSKHSKRSSSSDKITKKHKSKELQRSASKSQDDINRSDSEKKTKGYSSMLRADEEKLIMDKKSHDSKKKHHESAKEDGLKMEDANDSSGGGNNIHDNNEYERVKKDDHNEAKKKTSRRKSYDSNDEEDNRSMGTGSGPSSIGSHHQLEMNQATGTNRSTSTSTKSKANNKEVNRQVISPGVDKMELKERASDGGQQEGEGISKDNKIKSEEDDEDKTCVKGEMAKSNVVILNEILADPETNFIDLGMNGGGHHENNMHMTMNKCSLIKKEQQEMEPKAIAVKKENHQSLENDEKQPKPEEKMIEMKERIIKHEESEGECELKSTKVEKTEEDESLEFKAALTQISQRAVYKSGIQVNQEVLDAANALFSLSGKDPGNYEASEVDECSNGNQSDSSVEDLHYFEEIDEQSVIRRLNIIDRIIQNSLAEEQDNSSLELGDRSDSIVSLENGEGGEDDDDISHHSTEEREEDDDEGYGLSSPDKVKFLNEEETNGERQKERDDNLTTKKRSRSNPKAQEHPIVTKNHLIEHFIDERPEKRPKLYENDQETEKFSPTPSDNSVNSKENDTTLDKNHRKEVKGEVSLLKATKPEVEHTRLRALQKLTQQQRYSSEDLYKPRPVVRQGSRRRHMDTVG